MNDGAAALVVAVVTHLKRLGIDIPTLAKIVSWAQVRVDLFIMGISPITAIKKTVRTMYFIELMVSVIRYFQPISVFDWPSQTNI